MEVDNSIWRILVVDDEESIRIVLSGGLERGGYQVDSAGSVEEARELLNENRYFLVYLDITLPDGSGFDLLESIKKRSSPPSVVIMTAQATMKNAISAMREGAFDYITKPFDIDEIEILTQRIVDYRKMSNELSRLKTSTTQAPEDEIVGRSPAMQEVFKLIGRSANSEVNILITGPTGAGKELIARALHNSSDRADKPFVAINCAAIPAELLESELFGHVKGAFTGAEDDKPGKFEIAGEGSVLLDEVGDMPLKLQAKMLRVLQDKEFYPVGGARPLQSKARVIASTNRDLGADIASGRFREDLYHRLDVVRIHLPPLNERKSDIPLLVESFLRKTARTLNEETKSVSPDVIKALMDHDWKGSVRELENVIRRSIIMAPGETITIDDIPEDISGPSGKRTSGRSRNRELARLIRQLQKNAPHGSAYAEVIGEVEKVLIENALAAENNVQAKAAKALGLNRNTLAKKITELDIKFEKKG